MLISIPTLLYLFGFFQVWASGSFYICTQNCNGSTVSVLPGEAKDSLGWLLTQYWEVPSSHSNWHRSEEHCWVLVETPRELE